jgi:hypothetical protein
MGEMIIPSIRSSFLSRYIFSWYVIMSSLRDFENIMLRFL